MKWRRAKDKRDGRQFVALPMVVLESPGYRAASHTARSLLLDIAMQYTGNNNGRLTASAKYLQAKGWSSNDTIVRARRELLDCGLLIETRKGARPNKAAWYALTWHDLDQATGLDLDPKHYRRGEYMRPETPKRDTKRDTKNAAPAPSDGARGHAIAPSHGARPSIYAPSDGAMRAP
ncbi:hypothetical protein [Piscinibacter sp.]|uniref:hypothetical protein n=1 Tax=Piscinibacter sp. TaxID=1903157 RepID=UPI0035B1FC28